MKFYNQIIFGRRATQFALFRIVFSQTAAVSTSNTLLIALACLGYDEGRLIQRHSSSIAFYCLTIKSFYPSSRTENKDFFTKKVLLTEA